jgi:hypothetical protein
MDRIVDIETDNLHLSVTRGFMAVELNRQEIGRIALLLSSSMPTASLEPPIS